MLRELHIENFALIDNLTVNFSPGLNILTGETGAGKSIVIDAINVLLGERAGTEFIRTGASRAILQATFDVADTPYLIPALYEIGVEPDEDLVILFREVAREGKNIARINGRTCPVSVVRQVGDLLVDLHGQHEHQSLLHEDRHMEYLDAMGDDKFATLKSEVTELAQRRTALLTELHGLQQNERDRQRAIDLLSYQIAEIDHAKLTPEEEEELGVERIRLANAEKLHDAASLAYSLLYEGDEGLAVLDALGKAQMQLASLQRFDIRLEALADALNSSIVQINEVCRELSDYRDKTQYDPARLAEIEERLAQINTLKRKYGDNINAVLGYAAQQQQELDRLTHYEEQIAAITLQLAGIESTLAEKAEQLSQSRSILAASLAAELEQELAQLGMPGINFQVVMLRQSQDDGIMVDGNKIAVTQQGIDTVAFHISANPGEPPRPLAKIASGGEMSRIMLALKAISSRGAGIPTLIFDEIDTGIGGRTAEVVGAKLARVARQAQVICVTHLAQIAYYSDQHFHIEKVSEGSRTVSRMRSLSYEERVEELARLQTGERISDAVLTHVRDVIAEIHQQKQ